MNLTKLAKQIHETAVEKGWWDQERNKDEMHMLEITELAESVEADREGREAKVQEFHDEIGRYSGDDYTEMVFKNEFEIYIKDTVEDELADTVIRCLDYLYWKDRDYINIPNLEREWSDNFAENILFICKQITNRRPEDAVGYLFDLAEHMDIDIEWHIEQKMKYNDMRSRKHGGKKY